MKKNLFQEYLNSRGKIDKPEVDATADRVDPMTPPAAPKGGKPYKAGKDKSKPAAEKGFGDMGDQSLKFKHDEKIKSPAPAKLPTCEKVEIATLVVKQCAKDPTLLEAIVKQIKEKKLLAALVGEIFEHKETFNHISEIMAHEQYGPTLCSKLIRSMNEQTAPTFASQIDDEDHQEEELDANFDPEEDELEGLAPEDAPPSDGTEPPTDDPNMLNQDPAMMGNSPMMDQQPMDQAPSNLPPAMANFQRAMMRRYQRAMMSKN